MSIHLLPVADQAIGEMVRGRGLKDSLAPSGPAYCELIRDGRVIARRRFCNGVTGTAKNALLNGWFNAGTLQTAWYIGLVDAATYSSFNPADVMTSHLGWTEFTAYTVSGNGSNRSAWGQGAAAGQAVTNSAAAAFVFTGSGSVQGIFVPSGQVKSTTTGLLWSTASFTAPLAVATSDQLNVTYTVQL